MSYCPHCCEDPLKDYDSDQLYNMGAYEIDKESNIKCSNCRKDIVMRPFESIDYDFEEIEDEE